MDEITTLRRARRERELSAQERALTRQAIDDLEAALQKVKDLLKQIEQEDADAATVLPPLDKNTGMS